MLPGIEHAMKFFSWSHLPVNLQEVSRPFAELAQAVADRRPNNLETVIAIRKLLEAKDAAVRAML